MVHITWELAQRLINERGLLPNAPGEGVTHEDPELADLCQELSYAMESVKGLSEAIMRGPTPPVIEKLVTVAEVIESLRRFPQDAVCKGEFTETPTIIVETDERQFDYDEKGLPSWAT